MRSGEGGSEWGRLYRLDAQGALEWFTNSRRLRFWTFVDYNRYIASEEAAPYVRESLELHLSCADAKAFQRELIALRQRYYTRSSRTDQAEGKTYQFRACFVASPE